METSTLFSNEDSVKGTHWCRSALLRCLFWRLSGPPYLIAIRQTADAKSLKREADCLSSAWARLSALALRPDKKAPCPRQEPHIYQSDTAARGRDRDKQWERERESQRERERSDCTVLCCTVLLSHLRFLSARLSFPRPFSPSRGRGTARLKSPP